MEINSENITEDGEYVGSEQKFSINQWFNQLPIRIIGSAEEPFFYASDLAAILEIKNIRTSMNAFVEKDIVSPMQREKNKITTYKKYKNVIRRDDKIILLTERGAYRLINNSKSKVAESFQNFIYDLIHNTRISESEQLKIIHQNDIINLNTTIESLNAVLKEYRNNIPIIYVFKKDISDNPYIHMHKYEIDSAINIYDEDEKVESLYKLTIKPSADDYTNYILYAKIYGIVENIFPTIENTLYITERASKYCIYITEDTCLDSIDGTKIIYM